MQAHGKIVTSDKITITVITVTTTITQIISITTAMSIQTARNILIQYSIRIEQQRKNQVNTFVKVLLRILSKKAFHLLNQRHLINSIKLKYHLSENLRDSLTLWFSREQVLQRSLMI